jgi:hypothetical protein
MLKFTTISVILFLAFISPSLSATYNFDASKQEIVVNGDLDTPGESDIFLSMLKNHPETEGVRLEDSHGGIMSDGMKIGEAVYDGKLYTVASNFCYSACGYIWLAGAKKYVIPQTEMIEHLPNVDNVFVPFNAMGEIYWYLGRIGQPEGMANKIVSSANYFDNKAFDFLNFMDVNYHDSYEILDESTMKKNKH